ncbi:MAG: hypothetical protein EBZ48_14710, partial [Proteobacteria bacterium]|nr:hypothetical protein [Pseudomonadota bacterium]
MLLEAIERVRERLNLRRRLRAVVYLTLACSAAVLGGVCVTFFSVWAGVLGALLCAALAVWVLWYKSFFQGCSGVDAARTLDTLLETKDRALSYFDLIAPDSGNASEQALRSSKRQFIERQCEEALRGFDPTAALPIQFSSGLRWACAGILVLWLLAAAL